MCYALSLLISCSLAAEVNVGIQAEADSGVTPVPFSIGKTAFDAEVGAYYIAAQDNVADDDMKSYALAFARRGKDQLYPLTSESVTINGQEDQENPLYGAGYAFLRLAGNLPIAVTKDSPNRIYLVSSLHPHAELIDSEPLLCADKAECERIIGLESGAGAFVAAVQAHDEQFGNGTNSGLFFGKIAATKKPKAEDQESQTDEELAEGDSDDEDSDTDETRRVTRLQAVNDDHWFLPIHVDAPALCIDHSLATIYNDATMPVAIHFNENINRIYTGFSLRSGDEEEAGACALLNGNINAVMHSAVEADSIVATSLAATDVSIHALRSMRTSTQLDYVVVHGGVGAQERAQQSVYALPIVNAETAYKGALASKNQTAIALFGSKENPSFNKRLLYNPAVEQGDLYSSADTAACVGNGSALPGNITDIYAVKDAVYVSVKASDEADSSSGVFYSQALFSVDGQIAGWTDWQRAFGATDAYASVAIDVRIATCWLLRHEIGDDQCISLISKTGWANKGTFIDRINQQFTDTALRYGVDIPCTQYGCSQEQGKRLSFMFATGRNKVVVAQSSTDTETGIKPVEESNALKLATSEDGTLPREITDGFAVSGGDLEKIGTLTAAALHHDGEQSWIVVGGARGVAVLASSDGAGIAGAIEKDFANINNHLLFQQVASLPRVRKIITDREKLYIVADNGVYRVHIDAADVAGGKLSVEPIATRSNLPGNPRMFYDALISGSFAALATDAGLYRIEDGETVHALHAHNQKKWKHMPLPENVGAVTRFFAVSPSGIEADVATSDRPGCVYVLNADSHYDKSRVYRFIVQAGAGSEPMKPSSFVRFPDQFMMHRDSYFMNRGSYRSSFATDGALFFMGRSRYVPMHQAAFVESLPERMRGGVRLAARTATIAYADDTIEYIGPMFQRSATGSWMVVSDNGLVEQS
jgi:hypothetical protein